MGGLGHCLKTRPVSLLAKVGMGDGLPTLPSNSDTVGLGKQMREIKINMNVSCLGFQPNWGQGLAPFSGSRTQGRGAKERRRRGPPRSGLRVLLISPSCIRTS